MRARLRQALDAFQNRQVSWRAALILYAVAFAAAAALAAGWQVVRGPDGAPRQQAESLAPVTPVPVPTAPAADCGGEDDLVVATGDDISTGSVRREVFDRWNQGKKLPGDPPAKLLELSGSTDVRRAQMAALAQAGSCQYDVLVLDVAWVAEYARHGYIRPIPLSEPDRFLPGPLRAAEIDGEQYGVPFASDAPLEFRRTDVPAGGYLLQLSDREAGTINFLEMIEYGGGQLLDGDDRTSLRLGDDTWRSLASPRRRTFTTGEDVRVLQESFDLDEDSSVAAFKDGRIGNHRVSYMRNWPIVFHQLAADPRMRDSEGELLFEVRAPETPGGVLGGSVLALSAHLPPDKVEPAMRLIEFLVSKDEQHRLFACGGYGPVLTEVYDDYRQGRGTVCGAGRSSELVAVTLAELEDLAEQVEKSVGLALPRPKSPYYAQFSAAFRRCARGVWEEKVKEETFLSAADLLRSALDGRVPDGQPPC